MLENNIQMSFCADTCGAFTDFISVLLGTNDSILVAETGIYKYNEPVT